MTLLLALSLSACAPAEGCPSADPACAPVASRPSDPALGAPEPLLAGELSTDLLHALAERFQPAQVFAGRDIWPVAVDWCWKDGGTLTLYPPGSAGDTPQGTVQLPPGPFDFQSLDLPPATVVQVDCPGDNSGPGAEEATWLDLWRETQGDDPTSAPWAPVHYVHPLWHDKQAHQLMLQYWFWYPFDKFANNHEGDWEHVNVVLDLDPPTTLLDVHFFFHGTSMRVFDDLTRVGDAADGDHVLVYTSGCGSLLEWSGCYSGASWPWPGTYQMLVAEDTTPELRWLHPDDIGVILLPEPSDPLEVETSWLPLDARFGQWWVEQNHPILSLSDDSGAVPPQPYFKGSWNRPSNHGWQPQGRFERPVPPDGWRVLFNPPPQPAP